MPISPNDMQPHPENNTAWYDTISYTRYASIALAKLHRHYILLVVLTLLLEGGALCILAMSKPEFTAIATVGAAPSPLGDLTGLSSNLSGVLGSGLTRRLGLGGRTGGTDVFDQFTQLLQSSRLAQKLAQDPNVLRAIFYKKYDWEQHTWKSPTGFLADVKNSIKNFLHYPTDLVPDQDDVRKFLGTNVGVDAPLTSSFVTVSLVSDSPEKAEWLLNTMLLDADTIIRENKHRDVVARINYLTQTLPSVTQADQKQALSMILSDQQQLMMTLRADQRYASALIDPPHASPWPTSPDVVTYLASAFTVAILCWGLLVTLLGDFHPVLKFFSWRGGARPTRRVGDAPPQKDDKFGSPMTDMDRLRIDGSVPH